MSNNRKNKELPEIESDNSIVPDLDDQPITEPRCKVCNSKYRQEAEAYFEKTKSYARVAKFLHDDRQLDVSETGVRNHLKFHYVSTNNNELVNHFAEEVKPWFHMQSDAKKSMYRTLAGLDRMQYILMAQMEGLTLDEQRRTVDSIKKIADTILNYRSKIVEIERETEPIAVVLQQLKEIMQQEINEVNSNEAVDAIKNILSKLQDQCGDMMIERKQT